jgi:hypothetical protein
VFNSTYVCGGLDYPNPNPTGCPPKDERPAPRFSDHLALRTRVRPRGDSSRLPFPKEAAAESRPFSVPLRATLFRRASPPAMGSPLRTVHLRSSSSSSPADTVAIAVDGDSGVDLARVGLALGLDPASVRPNGYFLSRGRRRPRQARRAYCAELRCVEVWASAALGTLNT